MPNLKISFFFFLTLIFPLFSVYREYYSGSLTEDGLIRFPIVIPRDVIRLGIEIARESPSNTHPRILLRYNAVPTVAQFDKAIDFSNSTSAVINYDTPRAGTLIIAVWGGKLPHSFRYFAGSPVSTKIEISVEMEFCEAPFSVYTNSKCSVAGNLPLYSNYSVAVTDTVTRRNRFQYYRVWIPPGISLVSFKLEAVTPQKLEGKFLVSLNPDELNDELLNSYIAETSNWTTLVAHLSLPLPGLWTVLFLLPKQSENISFAYSITSDYDLRSEIVNPLQVYHRGNEESIYFSDPDLRLKKNCANVFRLDWSKYSFPLGQSLQVVLQVFQEIIVEAATPPEPIRLRDTFNFSIFGRVGNLPTSKPILKSAHVNNDIELFSAESIVKLDVLSILPFADGLFSIKYVMKINWLILHPYLPMIDSEKSLYLMLTNNYPQFSQGNFSDDPKFSLAIFAGYCPVGACVHGDCFVEGGNLATSTCYCRYPWAGERCESLTVPYWFYEFQVFSLTFANFAMIPAIYFSFSHKLLLLSVGLFLSMTASFVYHLCDTDYYCLFGFSFLSLQAFDILFCNAMIFSVFLLYSGLRQQTQEILSLFFLGANLALTINNPTNPLNLVLTLFTALAVVLFSWIFDWILQYRGIPSLLRIYQQGKGVIKHRDPSDVEEQSLLEKEIEMPSRQSNSDYLVERRNLFFFRRSPLKRGNSSSAGNSVISRSVQFLFYMKTSIVGLIIGIIGLSFFITQTRTNYWLFHSFWHFFVMIGAFLCIRGKFELFDFLQADGTDR